MRQDNIDDEGSPAKNMSGGLVRDRSSNLFALADVVRRFGSHEDFTALRAAMHPRVPVLTVAEDAVDAVMVDADASDVTKALSA